MRNGSTCDLVFFGIVKNVKVVVLFLFWVLVTCCILTKNR